MQLVLSSGSQARKALLSRLQIPFEVFHPDVDETPLLNEPVTKMVERLALLKAQAAVKKFPHAYIIGSDSVGVLEEKLLTKPLTHENAVKQLQTMSGKLARFYTGICLLDAKTHLVQTAVEHYDVHFRELTISDIEDYLSKESTLACAGGFQAEGLGISLVKRFEGDDFTTLIGLPLIRLTDMLNKWTKHPNQLNQS